MARNILLVSNFFPPHTMGGAEIVAFREARALLSRGHQVFVLAGADQSEGAHPGFLNFDLYEGIPVYRLSLRLLLPDSDFHWAAAARRFRAVVACHDIQVVHFHNVMGLGATLLLEAKACGLRCILTLHDHWGFCFRSTLLRDNGAVCANYEECSGCQNLIQPGKEKRLPMRVRRDYVACCVKQADRLVFPSSYLASVYRQAGFPSERSIVLSNGIDLHAVKGGAKEPSDIVRFLWPGYLGEHKGIFVLLDALTQLAREPDVFQRCHLTIAGDGHLRSQVQAELKSRNLLRQVQFLGRVPRGTLLDLLRVTDVVVVSSVWPENEPVTLLEAIASGTATIATLLGGSAELVEDGKSGLLVNPRDPAALAHAMRRYILDPSLAAAHGKRNLERRAAFDETKTIDKLEQLLTGPLDASTAVSREPIVVTGGSGAPPETVGMVMQHLYDHLLPGRTPRFVWHEWMAEELWRSAILVWLWDGSPSESLVNLALRRGIPVLAPSNDWTDGLARHYGGVLLYRTYLEALAVLRSLLPMPALARELSTQVHAASRAATILSPRRAFNLQSGATI